MNEDITLVGYLDDDVSLEEDAVESMLRFWESSPDSLGGSSFNITNNPVTRETWLTRLFLIKFFNKLFLIDDGRQGAVLRSGINTMASPVLEDVYTNWLCGGATIWRRQIFDEFKYDEWFEGWAYVEDVDFSFAVSKKYKLAVVHSAKLQHSPPPYDSKKRLSFGDTLTKQRYYLVKKHPELSIALFYWSSLGQILFGFLYGIRKRNMEPIQVALGTLKGLFNIARGHLTQAGEGFRSKA